MGRTRREKLDQAIFRYVEAELRDYHQTKEEIKETKEDIAEELPLFDGNGRTCETYKISDPTYNKAMRIVTNKRLKRMEQTVKAIETVLNVLDRDKRRLVELRYFERRLAPIGVAMELNIADKTFYRWREEIIKLVAVEMGLVNAVDFK